MTDREYFDAIKGKPFTLILDIPVATIPAVATFFRISAQMVHYADEAEPEVVNVPKFLVEADDEIEAERKARGILQPVELQDEVVMLMSLCIEPVV